jgi:hypothetical protein
MKTVEPLPKRIPVKYMTIKRNSLLIAIIAVTFASCVKNEIVIDPDNPLIGNWTYSSYDDNALIFERSNGFINDHCYMFKPDGSMTERKNAGWCGTPPISYEDFPGTWSVINDTLIEVSVGYWGGTDNYTLDINFIDLNFLEVQYLRQD